MAADLHDILDGTTVRYSSEKYARRAALSIYRRTGRDAFITLDLKTGALSACHWGTRACGKAGHLDRAMLWRRIEQSSLAGVIRRAKAARAGETGEGRCA